LPETSPALRAGLVQANFINAVRSRKRENLTCEIEEGAISTTLVYSCTGDGEVNKMFKRDYRAPFVVPKFA
jgi:hypothetical protein